MIFLSLYFSISAIAAEREFSAAAQLLVAKEYEKAASAFQDLAVKSPANPKIFYNLGLAEFQLGKKGAAIGHFLQALQIDPDFRPAEQALTYAKSTLEVKELPHEVSLFDLAHDKILSKVSTSTLHLLTLFSLFSALWLLTGYLKRRKQALKAEIAPPTYSSVALLFQVLTVSLVFLLVLKIYDAQIQRAVMVEAKTAALANPVDGAPAIFDLYEGLVVFVEQESGDWHQVTYPGGSTGWVPKKSLLLIKGI